MSPTPPPQSTPSPAPPPPSCPLPQTRDSSLSAAPLDPSAQDEASNHSRRHQPPQGPPAQSGPQPPIFAHGAPRPSESRRDRSHTGSPASSKSYKVRKLDAITSHLRSVNYLRLLFFAVVVALSALLVAGATTSQLSDFHVLSISYQPTALGQLPAENASILSKTFYNALPIEKKIHEVRVGYFGLCAKISDDSWLCRRSSSSLIQALGVVGRTDPLNLIWIGNRFRNEGLSAIMLLLTLISACLSLVFNITLNKTQIFVLVSISSFTMLFSAFSAFNVALWQHLASSISASMIENLAYGAITCRNGPKAMAIAWVSVFMALSNAFLVASKERKYFRKADWDLKSASVSKRETHGSSSTETEEEIEMEEPRRQPSWQQAQPNFALLQAMMYLSGMADRETMTKHRNTTAWVDQTEQMRPGFAETIVETEAY